MWWRLIRPMIGSVDRSEAGKTYHHLSSKGARGYLRTSASGMDTSPNPAARSAANNRSDIPTCPWRPGIRASGRGTKRSLAPLPLCTVICR